MNQIAGTVIVFTPSKQPYFLVLKNEHYHQFVTASYQEEQTNMGTILHELSRIGIDISQLNLLDLVDVSYKHQNHTPLFVFALNKQELPTLQAPYLWTDTKVFKRILGNLTLDDIAGMNLKSSH